MRRRTPPAPHRTSASRCPGRPKPSSHHRRGRFAKPPGAPACAACRAHRWFDARPLVHRRSAASVRALKSPPALWLPERHRATRRNPVLCVFQTGGHPDRSRHLSYFAFLSPRVLHPLEVSLQFGFNCLEPLIDGFNRSEQLLLQSFRFILRRLFYFIRWRCCAWFFHMHMDMLTIRRFSAFVLNLFKRLLKFLRVPRHKEFAQLVGKAVPRAFVISHMPISY